jgi:hypothetical protein
MPTQFKQLEVDRNKVFTSNACKLISPCIPSTPVPYGSTYTHIIHVYIIAYIKIMCSKTRKICFNLVPILLSL